MIPVFKPLITKKIKTVLSTLNRGEVSGGVGLAIKEFESELQNISDASMLQRPLAEL